MIEFEKLYEQWRNNNREWIDDSYECGDYEAIDRMWEYSKEYAQIEESCEVVDERFFGFGTEDGDIDNRWSIDWIESMYENQWHPKMRIDKSMQNEEFEMLLRAEEEIEEWLRGLK
jgi:hypothetical protein